MELNTIGNDPADWTKAITECPTASKLRTLLTRFQSFDSDDDDLLDAINDQFKARLRDLRLAGDKS